MINDLIFYMLPLWLRYVRNLIYVPKQQEPEPKPPPESDNDDEEGERVLRVVRYRMSF